MKITNRPVAAPVSTASAQETAAPTTAGAAAASPGWVAKSSAARPVTAAAKAGPADVVSQFYEAFARKDVEAMGKLYAPNVKFKDALFQFGDAASTTKMWRKLFSLDPNAKLQFKLDSVQGDVVKGHWVGDYTVSGRPVHNETPTTLRVVDGKIVEHHDDWSWDRWAPQALPAGKLFTLPLLERVGKALVRAKLS